MQKYSEKTYCLLIYKELFYVIRIVFNLSLRKCKINSQMITLFLNLCQYYILDIVKRKNCIIDKF